MTSIIENLKDSKEFTNLNIFENYYEVSIPKLDDMIIQFNDDYASCISLSTDNLELIKKINMKLISNNSQFIQNIFKIYNELKKQFEKNGEKENLFLDYDPLYLFKTDNVKVKATIDRSKALEKFKQTSVNSAVNIPKGLKLNHKQVFEMILSEVESVNKNLNYKHYIVLKDNDPYKLCFRFKYEDGKLGKKLRLLKNKFDIDYIEIIFNLDNSLYPFVPPTIEYSKPNIKKDVIFNLKNLNVLKKNWNLNISLEWLIVEIGKKFETYFYEFIDIDNIELQFSEIDNILFDTFVLMGTNYYNDFNIIFDVPKFDEKSKPEYWSSGVGYGYEGTSEWDIQNFLLEQENKISDVIYNLNIIKKKFSEYYDKDYLIKTMTKFISDQFRGTTIFDFNSNKKLYITYLEIIDELKLTIDFEIVSNLYYECCDIINDEELYNTLSDENATLDEFHTKEFCDLLTLQFTKEFGDSIAKILNKEDKSDKKSNEIVSSDLKQDYVNFMNMNKFGTYKFNNKHLFFKEKDNIIKNKKNLLSLLTEISSLKKNIPINWDTSCLLRIDKKQSNMIKFIITGPKDTPYHNGIYEFHAYFPPTYPNDPPKVLLNTTNGGRVRFNPNLYDSGKVCLSLLGTWSGQNGEKWNAEISTFLQVIISIQSLILVDEPYYNEPGWEKQMHTTRGKKAAFAYKDRIRFENLRVAIIDQFMNPPEGFEDVVLKHFLNKKEEILCEIKTWADESEYQDRATKKKINNLITEFEELF